MMTSQEIRNEIFAHGYLQDVSANKRMMIVGEVAPPDNEYVYARALEINKEIVAKHNIDVFKTNDIDAIRKYETIVFDKIINFSAREINPYIDTDDKRRFMQDLENADGFDVGRYRIHISLKVKKIAKRLRLRDSKAVKDILLKAQENYLLTKNDTHTHSIISIFSNNDTQVCYVLISHCLKRTTNGGRWNTKYNDFDIKGKNVSGFSYKLSNTDLTISQIFRLRLNHCKGLRSSKELLLYCIKIFGIKFRINSDFKNLYYGERLDKSLFYPEIEHEDCNFECLYFDDKSLTFGFDYKKYFNLLKKGEI